ncbi:MAG TPA: class I SAM-dependent methyltransferase [Myxococcota bacterium]|nr:class I SAM-dependent methyltransferase [Myxococcota bacterium]
MNHPRSADPSPTGDSLVHVPCDLCGADRPIPVLVENGYEVCRCAGCSLVYVNPQPRRELGEDVELFHGEAREIEENRTDGEVVYDDGLDRIERDVPGRGRLLDVGCGFGFFLERAAARGWQVHGIDVSRVTVEYARKRLGLDTVERGDLFQARYPDGHFQAVCMWNCLEHLPQPLETLREVARILADGGVVLVRVPNIDFSRRVWSFRPLMRFAGVHEWSYLGTYPPHHLYGFTPRTLGKMLARAGLDVLSVAPAAVKIVHYERQGWRAGFAARAVARVSDLAYRGSGGRWNLSATMVACARKPASTDGRARG